MVRGSVSWAKLEPAGESRVSKFIDSLDENEGEKVTLVTVKQCESTILTLHVRGKFLSNAATCTCTVYVNLSQE